MGVHSYGGVRQRNTLALRRVALTATPHTDERESVSLFLAGFLYRQTRSGFLSFWGGRGTLGIVGAALRGWSIKRFFQ